MKSNGWFHYVAAVKDKDGREYGIQATRFEFGDRMFCNCAITDVQAQKHHRLEDYPKDGGPTQSSVQHTMYGHQVEFTVDGIKVELDFQDPGLKFTGYPSETSEHFGHPRMEVSGYISGAVVTGVGCFDREIFDKLLKPGEIGWTWAVAWLDDGTTRMYYKVHGTGPSRQRIYDKRMPLMLSACPDQYWPRNEHRDFIYSESLCILEGMPGRGYSEIVNGINI